MATIRDEIVQPIPSKFMFSFKLSFDWSGYGERISWESKQKIHVKSIF